MVDLVVIWWVVGIFLVIRDIKKVQRTIEVEDFVPILFLGFVGPIMYILELLFGKNK